MIDTDNSDTCERIRQALVAGAPGSAEDELRHHLDGCEQCRSYLRTLERVRFALSAGIDELEPDPQIQERLRTKLRETDGASILRILRRPVPAYQAVLAAAAAVAAVLIIESLEIAAPAASPSPQDRIGEQTATDSEVLANLRLVGAKGRSHAEDSLLVEKVGGSFAPFDGSG